MNDEGIAFAPETECAGGRKACFWADDEESNGYAIHRWIILWRQLY